MQKTQQGDNSNAYEQIHKTVAHPSDLILCEGLADGS